ncbi:histone deacetylase domain-containing protein, partial [Lipomyces arxii]|uniref:histone deacetylase domain-containing protein n=1 Tax=Lipomyces arxii TaxID=56418 RepID=UPI0034CED04C
MSLNNAPFPSFTFTELLNDDEDEFKQNYGAISAAEQAFLDETIEQMTERLAEDRVWQPQMPLRFAPDDTPHTPVKEEASIFLPDDLADQIAGLNLQEKGICTDESNKTLLLLSPLSYLHVFSRKWVAKKYLASIVERPQRLNACAVGIGAAMVLAGVDNYVLETCAATTKLDEAPHVTKVHGKSWPEKLKLLCMQSKDKLDQNQLEVPEDWHSGDIYLSEGTISAVEGVVGTLETAVDRVFDNTSSSTNRCFVSIRPPGHHSHPCTPSGFCLINNVHVAIQYAAAKHGLTHAVILDFDLHHGDGSQDICWKLAGLDSETEVTNSGPEQVGPKIGYFSLHDVNSFPTELGYATAEHIKNSSVRLMAHGMCIWNIHLEPYSTREEFDSLYNTRYSELFTRASEFLSDATANDKPVKTGVFLSAGFDASEFEDKGMQRHGVHVPTSFYFRFTKDAVSLANKHANGRVISMLEGGYSDAAICSGVMAHLLGLQGQEWNDEYSSPAIVKQLEKGCKTRWGKPKMSSVNKSWVVGGIERGRAMASDGALSSIASLTVSAASTPGLSQDAVDSSGGRRILRNRKGTPTYNESSKTASPLVSRKMQDKFGKLKVAATDETHV